MKIVYQCETCETTYTQESDAAACEARTTASPRFVRGFRFGDWEIRSLHVVRTAAGHGWVYDARAWDPQTGDYRHETFPEDAISGFSGRRATA